MEREGEDLVGNHRYEGFSLDLIDEISKELNFKYEFYLAPDGKYGSYNKVTKKWDGLVKEILDRVRNVCVIKGFASLLEFNIIFRFQKADLALCDLTITVDRENAVDFTMPFMTLGE